MQFKEDPKNLIVPLDLSKIIYSEWDADLEILDQPDQVYGKALHGKGRVKFKNGNSYEGQFFNGMLHGKGKFVWQSGVIFEGDFTYNRIEGEGNYYWPDGSTYTGFVSDGLRQGIGKFIASGDSAIYEGDWVNGLRHGQGQVSFKSGAVFVGKFVCGNKEGEGKMVYPTGNSYEGQFMMDKKCGYGTMNWLTSNEKYYGMWNDNMQNGWGVHIWLEQKGEGSKFLRNRYEGQWENGERSGVGVFYYANGAKYLGEWRNNLKNGIALFITDTGGLIVGEFKSDRLNKVYITSENESRTGILPREIAPKEKEEQENLQEQMQQKQQLKSQKSDKQLAQQKQSSKVQQKQGATSTSEKLAGINSPQNQTQSNLRSIEANPYSYMIDISDLYRGLNVDAQLIETNVQTMLLRHNSVLRQWYRFFATKYEHLQNEDTFSLNLESFWRITRDAKLLSGNFSLAQLNRLYAQGVKNDYPLNYKEEELLRYVEVMKSLGKNINLDDLQDLFHIDVVNQFVRNDQQLSYLRGSDNVHNPKKCVLFRNFVELIVRLSYLKYGSLVELHRAIERVIINKLTPLYERKKGKLNQSEDENKSAQLRSKVNFEEYIQDIEPLFKKYSNNQGTITLKGIFNLFEKCKLMVESDKAIIIAFMEKNFDTDESTLNQPSALDQSSVNQTKEDQQQQQSKPRRKKQENDGRQNSTAQVKIDKWVQYLHYEFTLFEFSDLLISYLLKKVTNKRFLKIKQKKNKDLVHPREEEQRNRLLAYFKKLTSVEVNERVNQKQKRLWPKSVKDDQKESLKQLRIQQEARAKQKKLNEEERKKEYFLIDIDKNKKNRERERNLMALEDQDVKSEQEDEDGDEDSDY